MRGSAPLPLAERRLAAQTLTALGISESAQTAMLSVTHAPIGKGGRNWITRLKPGNKGQLPAYIQNVRNAIMRGGTDESRATAIAIGRVRDWAEGKGNVSAEVRAAAAKAIAEWERDKAQNAATSKKVKETPVGYLAQDLTAEDLGDMAVLEADAEDKKDGGADETTEDMPSVYCVKCKAKRTPTAAKKCPNCGTDLATAVAAAKKVQEAVLEAVLSAADRKKLPSSAFAIPESRGYPIHDLSHAQNALARCSGKPEESRVKTAVYKRYPQLKPTAKKKAA